MLRVLTSNGCFLARRDIERESSSFCSTVSSAMKRLYLRDCDIVEVWKCGTVSGFSVQGC